MNIGDLVTMDYSDWPEGDEWGLGMIVEIDNSQLKVDSQSASEYVEVLWSKIGLSWEMPVMMKVINESR